MPTFTAVLDQKLDAVAGFPSVPRDVLRRVGDAIRGTTDDYDLFRVNPLAFAARHDLPPDDVVDVFIVAAKVGLFDFSFNLLCPGCGGVETTHRSWNGLSADAVYCAVCKMDVPVVLDEQVEVSFTIAETVARLVVDPFKSAADYMRFFFSSNFHRSKSHLEITSRIAKGFLLLQPGSSTTLRLEVPPGKDHRAISMDAHSSMDLPVTPDGAARVEIEVVPGGLAPKRAAIRAGQVELVAHNRTESLTGLVVIEDALAEIHAARAVDPSWFEPFLTAKQLLNHQRFRDLFKAQTLDPSLRLRIRSLTLLFTDLKGSTALYDSTGDVTAYGFVQEHFAALTTAVKKHRGAVVKTMGDAVMASFSRPEDALQAADEMLAAMRPVNDRVKDLGHSTGLKVGIHEGAALAVASDERLDYFGQTVNIAARVQALADAGEIWVTAAVMNAPVVAALVAERGYASEAKRVALKGVGHPTDVFRLSR